MFHPEPSGAPARLVVTLPAARAASLVPVRSRQGPAAVDAYVSGVYGQYQRELFGFLLRVTRDASAAEDIAQESFLRLCRELQRGAEPPGNVRAWLYRVAGNLAVSRGRHAVVARRWLDHARSDEETFEAPERTALRLEAHTRLQAVLADLPREQRVALLMAAQGFSGHEIALVLDRSDVSTRTMLCRARLRLRLLLERDEPAEGRGRAVRQAG